MMNPKKAKQYAEVVRKLGAKNVKGDTELVHVTRAEKAELKDRGGSGRIDPTTGLAHFDAGGQRSKDNPGQAGNSAGRDTSGGKDDEKDKPYRDLNAERASRFSTPEERAAIEKGDYSSAGPLGGMKPGEGYVGLTGMQRFWAGLKSVFGGAKLIGGMAAGGVPGIVQGALGARKLGQNISEAVTGRRYHNAEGGVMSAPSSGNGGAPSVSGGNGNRGGNGPMANNTAVSILAPSPVAPVIAPLVQPLDYFSELPRSRQGWRSTIRGGKQGRLTPPKKLLGE